MNLLLLPLVFTSSRYIGYVCQSLSHSMSKLSHDASVLRNINELGWGGGGVTELYKESHDYVNKSCGVKELFK